MRRLLSTSVKVLGWSPLDPAQRAMPSPPDVRDAMARLIRDLEDMRLARHPDSEFDPGEPAYVWQTDDNGLWLRANAIVRQDD